MTTEQQLEAARTAAALWKRSAHDNRLRLILCERGWDGAAELNKKLLAENANLVSQLLRSEQRIVELQAGDTAG